MPEKTKDVDLAFGQHKLSDRYGTQAAAGVEAADPGVQAAT